MEEAQFKKAIEIARNMKNEGFDVEVIARMTGLSFAEINTLR
jgi:predicted transposase/invertase (TIGR01784 family)